MRPRAVATLVLLLAVACGVWLLLGRGRERAGRAAPDAPEPVAAVGAAAAALALPAPEKEGRPARPSAEQRGAEPEGGPGPSPRRELGPSPEDPGLRIYGRLRSDGGAALERPSIEFTRPDQPPSIAYPTQDGRYSTHYYGPLAAGEWRFRAAASNHHEAFGRVELPPGSPPLRLDVALRAKPVLVVRVVTPEGGPFPFEEADVRAFASLAAPERWLDAGELAGEFAPRGPGVRTEGPEVLGTLVLDVAPPVHVGLASGGWVLASQLVEPSTAEVLFVLAPDEVRGRHGSIAVRPVEAATQAPLDGAVVNATNGIYLQTLRRGPDGVWRATGLAPDTYVLTCFAEGLERGQREVHLEPDAQLDLGDWPLGPGRRLVLTVRDPAGEQVVLVARVGLLGGDRRAVRRDHERGHRVPLTIDGLGAARYVVLPDVAPARAGASDATEWTFRPLEVDLTTKEELQLEVVAEPALVLALEPAVDLLPGRTRVTLFTADGLRLVTRTVTPAAGARFVLAAGRYEVGLELPDGSARTSWVQLDASTTLELGP